MKGIILKKKELDDSSLLLSTWLEDGSEQTFKIPGILKSKKRSAFYYSAGTIWNFTALPAKNKWVIPKESWLLISPVTENVSYQSLLNLANLLLPLSRPVKSPHLFFILETLLAHWPESETEQQKAIAFFYLHYLQVTGYFQPASHCFACQQELGVSDYYVLGEGSYCQSCLRQKGLGQQALSLAWINCTLGRGNCPEHQNYLSETEQNLHLLQTYLRTHT